MKKNGSELIKRKNSNIHESLRKISSLDSTSSSLRPQKLKLINEFSPLMKMNENTSSKILDFPICLSLFTNNNKTINDKELKNKENNKLYINLKSIKPKNLNNLNLDEIIKPNNKKIISRNLNHFNSLSSIKTKKLSTLTRIFSPKKIKKLNTIKLDYSPSNGMTKNTKVLNSIGISPILKFNTKINTLSQNTMDSDIPSIKNMKGLSINNLNYNKNFKGKKIIPSLLSSPINIKNKKKDSIEKINNKKKILQIKKNIQKKINNFENKIDNVSINKINEEDNKKDKEIIDKKNELQKNNNNIELNLDNNKELEIIETRIKNSKTNIFHNNSLKTAKNKFNFENKLNHKYSSNVILYKVFLQSDKNSEEKNSLLILEPNKVSENQNQKKNSINYSINDNIAKMDRLIRLKKSSFKIRNNANKTIIIDSVKGEESIENDNLNNNKDKYIYSNNFGKKPDKKFKFVTGIERNNNNKNEIKVSEEFSRVKSTKNLNSNNLNIFNIKKNKFYLVNCKKNTNKIYEKNKFLRKCNDIVNEISSNNRMNRKIYVRKTSFLLDMKEKVGNIINDEKMYLENRKLKHPNIYEFYDKIPKLWIANQKDEKDISKFFVKKDRFNCNVCKNISIHILSTTDFNGFSSNIKSVIITKKTIFNETKGINKRSIKRKVFKTVNIKNSSSMKLKKKKGLEEFSINKTKNTYQEDIEWIYSPINLLSIQTIIIHSNNSYYNKIDEINEAKKGNEKMNIKRRSIVKKSFNKSESYNINHVDSNEGVTKRSKKQLSLGKRLSSLNFSVLKKNLKKTNGKSNNYNNFSLLNQKKFFKRTKSKNKFLNKNLFYKKQKNNNSKNLSLSNYSEKLSSSDNSSNIEDIYYELLSYIIEGKNKQFLRLFERNKRFIDINQKLIEGNTLLIISSREGNLILTKFLCSEGIKVNIQNDRGNTALHYAIGNQFYSIADILTRFGAREDISNNKGLLPWDCVENNLE